MQSEIVPYELIPRSLLSMAKALVHIIQSLANPEVLSVVACTVHIIIILALFQFPSMMHAELELILTLISPSHDASHFNTICMIKIRKTFELF